MLSSQQLKVMIDRYAKSPAGRNRIADQVKTEVSHIEKTVSYGAAMAKLVEEIRNAAPDSLKYLVTEDNFLFEVSKPEVIAGPTLGISVKIDFNRAAFERASVEKEKYGTVDIVQLFANGWEYPGKNRFKGTWTDHTGSKKEIITRNAYHGADDFVQEGINNFMYVYAKEYGVLECTLSEDYKKIG